MISNSFSAGHIPLFAFAGGGTGGHLYPAIAVARAIRAQLPGARFLFLGTQRPIDRKITDTIECEFVPQSLSGFSFTPWGAAKTYLNYRKAAARCLELFAADRPAIVVGTGGMASVPAVKQAWKAGITTALFNPDVIPGKANRFLRSKACCVFAQFEQSVDYFPATVDVSVDGCPVRPEFYSASRDEGLISFGLNPRYKTLLITGASLGARTLNQAAVANTDFFARCEDWQILHLTGDGDFEMVQSGYQEAGAKRVHVVAYTEHMAWAMAGADLIVSRAGASTLAEIMATGKPSILMPYPFHRDQHQVANARCLADLGAATIVMDAAETSANAVALRAALHEAMNDDDRRLHMASKAQRMGLARRDAAAQIAARLIEMAGLSDQAVSNIQAGRESLKAC